MALMNKNEFILLEKERVKVSYRLLLFQYYFLLVSANGRTSLMAGTGGGCMPSPK
jgi:hypothetical protein